MLNHRLHQTQTKLNHLLIVFADCLIELIELPALILLNAYKLVNLHTIQLSDQAKKHKANSEESFLMILGTSGQAYSNSLHRVAVFDTDNNLEHEELV